MSTLTRRDLLRLAAVSTLPIAAGCGRRPADRLPDASRPLAPEALFEDVAAPAGVRFVHTNGADGRFLYVESTPAGCALFDYDNDGYLDVLLIQSGPFAPPRRRRRPPALCPLP